jgi:general secretion pathway protein D
MKTVVTNLIGALLLAGATAARAQLPAPPVAPLRTNPTISPFAAQLTNRFPRTPTAPGVGTPAGNTAVPVFPGATPGTPGANVPNVAGVVPNFGPPGTTAGVSNVIPRGISSNMIGANVIKFQELDLSSFLDFYAELTGKTLLKSPQVPLTTKVTVRNTTALTKEEAIDALNTILGLNQIAMIPEGEKFIKVIPQGSVAQEATPFSTNTYDTLRDAQVPVAQIITLKNLTPEDAVSILTPYAKLPGGLIGVKGSPVLVVRDYSENVKRMMEILDRVDVALPIEIETVVIPIKYALAGEIAGVLSGLGASTGSGISGGGGGAGGFTSGGGGLGSGFGGGTGLGGGIGNPLGGGVRSGIGGVGGSYPGSTAGNPYGGGARPFGSSTAGRTAGGPSGFGSSGFAGRLNQAVNRSVGAAGGASGDFVLIDQAKIIPDDRSNALLIFANRRDLTTISNIISKLDVVLPQVKIEALIMEVNLGNMKDLGVSLQQNNQRLGDLNVAGGSVNGNFLDPRNITGVAGMATNSGLPNGFSYFGKLNQDFDVAVTAAATDSRINVLSRPSIVTSTAKPAHIFVGETRPYVTGTYFSGLSSGSQSQVSQTQIGITLDVMPIVNQDGLVTMDIQQHISQVGGQVPIDGNNVPITIERDANGYVSVNNRDTIVLGGFISTTKNTGKSGVPYLKDIPGLGFLFRSSTESIQRVELMVMIRPTVLPTPEAAAIATANMRDSLPNLMRSEREEQEFARKQLEKERKDQEKMERRAK